jgi:hypothetical protein
MTYRNILSKTIAEIICGCHICGQLKKQFKLKLASYEDKAESSKCITTDLKTKKIGYSNVFHAFYGT